LRIADIKIRCTFVKEITIKKIETMTTDFQSTGEQIKYENGKVFNIYSKMTVKGVRYYRWSLGRMFPISKNEINERIYLKQN
jgi:hypothetical protein